MPFVVSPYDSCHFCRCLAGEISWTLVAENEHAVAVVNPAQYEHGAMLCIPRTHRETILDVEDEEIDAVYRLAKRMTRAAELAFDAIGANVFQNNGVKGGQSQPHVHVHVVPRYESSDADVLFLQRNTPYSPRDQLERVAAAVQAVLGQERRMD
jgi:histidine triad (HIT) family protein